MLTHSDFCTFILSHGRPNNIRTLHPLLNTGNYTSPVRLPYAVPLSEIGLVRPPQSWQYLTEEQAALLR